MGDEPTQHDDGGPAFPRTEIAHNPMTGDTVSSYVEGMTLRQYAAIRLQVPNSGTDWLDRAIREARRMDFTGRAMATMVGHVPWPVSEEDAEVLAVDACKIANAVLAKQAKEEGG